MVRADISLPALMRLMGHAHILTTMLHVELAPKDVWREYARAVEQRVRLSLPNKGTAVKRLAPCRDEIFERHIQLLATTRRPHTVANYRYCARKFLVYLHATFPQLHKLSQLHRDPHLTGWLCFLCEQNPPIRNYTRSQLLIQLRRLLHDLADNGHHLSPDLIVLRTSPHMTISCPDRFPRKMMNAYNNSSAKRIRCSPMPCG